MSYLSPIHYQMLANTVLVVHTMIVVFVIGGLLATLLGGALQWRWIRQVWFRSLHLGAIAFVAFEAWAGIVCPLTTLEQWLRRMAGQATYDGDFVAYWLSKFMFFTAPAWVFTTAYSVFCVLVIASWIWLPPRRAVNLQRRLFSGS